MTLSRIYVAPTEPAIFSSLGKRTLLPESMGCDFLSYSYHPYTLVGFQRKELSDFMHSLADGRLEKELGQIAHSQLTYAVLILEGTPVWTNDGKLASEYGMPMTKSGWRGLLTTIQLQHIVVHQTHSSVDTLELIQQVSHYLSKSSHDSLFRRPKTSLRNSWGQATSSAFASHLLQSFPGVGPEMASNIYSAFGRIPLSWICTEDELKGVKGVGPKTARRLMDSLHD